MGNSRGGTGSRSRKKGKKRDTDSSAGTGITNSDSDMTPRLPDDLIEEIVSRLPIKDVIRFGCVSKTAANLISDRDFIVKHMKRVFVVPMIVVQHYGRHGFLLDKWWESNRNRAVIEKKCHLHPEFRPLLLSQDGFILSTREDRDTRVDQYIIFNPIYSETFEISVPSLHVFDGSRYILGVFYRPCVNHYSTLWEITLYGRALQTKQTQYRLLDLSSQSNWRNVDYPFSQYRCYCLNKSVLINGFLYWVCLTHANEFGIMVFDTSIEGFELLPCPITAAAGFNKEKSVISLLNRNGVPKLVQILNTESDDSFDVNIWALTDRVQKIWSTSQFRMMSRIGSIRGLYGSHQIIALWNGELVLVVDVNGRNKEIFVCNLKLGTTRQYGRRYTHSAWFMSHVMSLASIKS